MKKYWPKIVEVFKVYSVIAGIITIIAGGAISVDRFFQKFENITVRLAVIEQNQEKIKGMVEASAYYTEDSANAGFGRMLAGQKRIEKDIENLNERVDSLEKKSNRLYELLYDLQRFMVKIFELIQDKELQTKAILPNQGLKIRVEKK